MDLQNMKSLLEKSIAVGELSEHILDVLIPNGNPHGFETELWDYKREFPISTSLGEKEYSYRLHQLIKDIVALHNSHGGYLVFGVEDVKGKTSIYGISDQAVDCDDLAKRIFGATGVQIPCYFKTFSIDINSKIIGLLLVGKRAFGKDPVIFSKNGPSWDGKKPYSKGDIYVRRGAECVPATISPDVWKFLFSDRRIESVQNVARALPNNLPARDPDLVEFVGRSNELEQLRRWILDDKSPVRLLTGIGGLGKTSIAYKFSEELSRLGATDIDAITWLTAKQKTFSALGGELVSTTRCDFSTTQELLKKLVTEVCGISSLSQNDEEDELVEALIDGLAYRPTFFVIDDLDSLLPEEQRECASLLQQIALRTVGREHPCSHFLLTSRLDQGMATTMVIKISGLAYDEFETHLRNLCAQFKLQEPSSVIKKQIYAASSGSPLFASAIVRMVTLGSSFINLCDKWNGSDGQDVREFAFKRELERLSPKAASLLLAVLRLGQTGVEEIAEIVGLSKKLVIDAISELQTYHLISRTQDKSGETFLSASKELIAVKDILQRHLGNQATEIDRACAIVQKSQGSQPRNIGIEITKIVSLWSEEKTKEALIAANILAKANPKHGDVYCVLGRAYLEITPPDFQKADDALQQSQKYGCQRQEILSLTAKAKKGIQDWKGLSAYTKDKFVRTSGADVALDSFIDANGVLYDASVSNGRELLAAQYALEIVEKINKKIASQAINPAYFEALCQTKMKFAYFYIDALEKTNVRNADKLEIVNAVITLFDIDVRSAQLLLKATKALDQWFTDVEKRPVLDLTALNILKQKLAIFETIKAALTKGRATNDNLLNMIDNNIRTLGFRGGKLAR